MATLANLLLSSLTLASPNEIDESPEPWAPVRGEVWVDDDGLEVLAFDAADQLVGTLVLILPATREAGPIQIDASFPDAYVSAPLLLLDVDDLAAPEQLEPSLLTDLPLEEAKQRIEAMLAFVAPELEIGTDAQQLSKKQCAMRFAVATVICGAGALSGQIGIALACWATTHTAICSCSKYIPIKICDE